MPLPTGWETTEDKSVDDLPEHGTISMYFLIDNGKGDISWADTPQPRKQFLDVCLPPHYLKDRIKEMCGKQIKNGRLCPGKKITHILRHTPTGEFVGLGFVHGVFKIWTPWGSSPETQEKNDIVSLVSALWTPEEGETMYPEPRRSGRLKRENDGEKGTKKKKKII